MATGERTPTTEPPRFVVVIPSYQQGEFIERTIRSVLDQDAEMDVVVRDGGSTDGTVEVLERFGDALRFGPARMTARPTPSTRPSPMLAVT